MRKGVVPALAIAMTMTAILSARSDEIPTLDVGPVCRGIASQSGEELEAGLESTSAQCVKSEQEVREQLRKEWSTFSAADKRHCVTLSKIGGSPVTPNSSHVWKWPEMCEPTGQPPQERPRPELRLHPQRPPCLRSICLRPLHLRPRPLRLRPLRLRPGRQCCNQHLRLTSPRRRKRIRQ